MNYSVLMDRLKEKKKYVIAGILIVALILFVTVTSSVVTAHAQTAKPVDYYKVNLGKKTVAKFETKADAEKVISAIEKRYVEDGSEVVSVKCEPALSVTKESYNANEKKPSFEKDGAKLAEHLLTGDVAEKFYEVKDGDAMFEVAGELGLTFDELKAMNSDKDLEILLPGDKVKYQANEPLVNVITEQKVKREEVVPFESETVPSAELYKGETRVETPGEPGTADVLVREVCKNGVTQEAEELEKTVTKEPVTQVILEGTKEKPVYTPTAAYGGRTAATTGYRGYGGYSATSTSVAPPASGSGASIAAYAQQWVGVTPYVYGGRSLTAGADCSGFVSAVYSKCGYSVPSSSFALQGTGYAVSPSNMAPGDIIVYGNHASIYVGGGCECHSLSPRSGTRVTPVGTMGTGPIVTVRRVA